ncbi:hypothetical protein [Clostridium gasigenes]|uniref:Uncharacterized protein n=1 Tax=Clostridium gasigenes TaxID=94869 RepID=A0A1H0T4M8_9CLOT|nr:hypothetical protein [Clostridium gasigenes]SDP48904.1 hypothetical protein SAMN04488529_10663 [Clostridium gasigenes]
MNKNLVSTLFKSLLFGIVWASIAFVLAIILVKLKHYNLKDILFIEGILLIAISILSSIGGNPTGLSMQGISNPTLTSYTNLETTRSEREKNPIKQTVSFALSSIALILGGLLLILLNFIV